MVYQKVVITNPLGLHARPASLFFQAAKGCRSEVKILSGNQVIEGKNLLDIMAASIKEGTEIELRCDGVSEKEDIRALTELLINGLWDGM
ncbi:HPr family phosphocarrier protein [Lachnospiraceae bacterium 54-53]